MYKIVSLDQQFLTKHIDQFIKIVRQVDYQYWDKKNFLLPLPGKWDTSFVAVDSAHTNNVIGFIICSVKNDEVLHEHKLFVHSNYRKIGIGKKLLKTALIKAKDKGIETISLNVYEESKIARKLYDRIGFTEKSQTVDNIGLRFLLSGNIDKILENIKKSSN